MYEQILVNIVVGLHNIYLPFYLFCDFLYLFLVAVSRDGVFVYVAYARCRDIYALYIHLLPGEHCGHLAQYSGNVLRIDEQRV